MKFSLHSDRWTDRQTLFYFVLYISCYVITSISKFRKLEKLPEILWQILVWTLILRFKFLSSFKSASPHQTDTAKQANSKVSLIEIFFLQRRISLTTEPIWFSFTLKLLIGPRMVFTVFGEGSTTLENKTFKSLILFHIKKN